MDQKNTLRDRNCRAPQKGTASANTNRFALTVSLTYAVTGGLCILLSDGVLSTLVNDPLHLRALQTGKGWFIVLLTSLLLFFLIRYYRKNLFRSEEYFNDMVRGVSSATGEEFFNLLVQNLGETLKADYVFIGELIGENRGTVRTVAVHASDREMENFSFALAGTPCEKVISQGICRFESHVREKFPLDHVAVEMGVESYVGVPLFDSTGRVIGPMAILGRTPLEEIDLAEKMLRVFAVRAAAELERARSEKTIEYMAYYDPLTGLPNSRLFNDRLGQILQNAQRNRRYPAVMFIDLDRFKNINDTLGHIAGDELLKAVAERLASTLRKEDTVARLGGDEFLVLLPDISQAEDAAVIAAKLVEAMKPSFTIHGLDLHVALSIGIAIFPFDGECSENLLKNADTALNRAKELGRNNYQFYLSEMNESSLHRLGMESMLRKALERSEFLLHFQPQYNLCDQEVIGFEALLRWQHPEKGMVSPGEFVPLAEETGLIGPIGEWVLRTACHQNKAWQNAGFEPKRIAVNLSARQFYRQDMVGTVQQVLAETGLDPCWLELEITESLIMQDVEEAIHKLRQIRETGVHIAIDDFGTGYSSLSYLQKFPIDTLKIDRSFIRDLTASADGGAIVDAVIALAHSLKLKVVAEGVETDEQMKLLFTKKCDRVQGFFLGRPQPVERCSRFLNRPHRIREGLKAITSAGERAR